MCSVKTLFSVLSDAMACCADGESIAFLRSPFILSCWLFRIQCDGEKYFNRCFGFPLFVQNKTSLLALCRSGDGNDVVLCCPVALVPWGTHTGPCAHPPLFPRCTRSEASLPTSSVALIQMVVPEQMPRSVRFGWV